MSENLADLILALAPEDGSSIGNGAMMALLGERVSRLADEDYVAARDALIDEGVLGRGRGRGGSIFRLAAEADDDEDDENRDEDDDADGFALIPGDEPAPRQRKATGRKKRTRNPDDAMQVLSYRHGQTRVNNPEVGMVHAGTDPDGEKTVWAYDPHLDPVLNFDSARAFTSQLLCEQVVGRGLRRVSYDTDESGLFLPEYVNVFGVPLSISETGEGGEPPPPPKPTTQIEVVLDRADREIRWPNVLRVEAVVRPAAGRRLGDGPASRSRSCGHADQRRPRPGPRRCDGHG